MTEGQMSDIAIAYVAEAGTLPKTREEQNQYAWFRFGYEAGVRAGRIAQNKKIVEILENA